MHICTLCGAHIFERARNLLTYAGAILVANPFAGGATDFRKLALQPVPGGTLQDALAAGPVGNLEAAPVRAVRNFVDRPAALEVTVPGRKQWRAGNIG